MITPASNIMGIRLQGPPVKPRVESSTKQSKGTIPGAIQVPPDAQPIILLNQRGTVGGYPVVATLPSPELWRLAQWPTAKTLSFVAISPAQAQALSKKAFQDLMTWHQYVTDHA
jgi:allophanate hydrolase subunit 2